MNEMFRYKPPKTQWIGCELFVSYDCNAKPTVAEVVITGVKQFGFILSHEYDIKAFVGESHRESCAKEQCDHAVKYNFDVIFYVFEKVGLGFGLGSGTGTAGWTTRSTSHLEKFTTRCICCDEDASPTRPRRYKIEPWRSLIEMRSRNEAGIAAVATSAALGVGLAYSTTYINHPLSQAFLVSTGAATALSALVTAWRLSKFRSRKISSRGGGATNHGSSTTG